MQVARMLTRRQALVAGTLAGGMAAGGCSANGPGAKPRRSAKPSPSATQNAADARLRERAIADERRLLAACTGAANGPVAAIGGMHVKHLQRLTGKRPAVLPSGHPTATATLIAAERKAAAARRTDCLAASGDLAPLLASIAAASEVAVVLLSP